MANVAVQARGNELPGRRQLVCKVTTQLAIRHDAHSTKDEDESQANCGECCPLNRAEIHLVNVWTIAAIDGVRILMLESEVGISRAKNHHRNAIEGKAKPAQSRSHQGIFFWLSMRLRGAVWRRITSDADVRSNEDGGRKGPSRK